MEKEIIPELDDYKPITKAQRSYFYYNFRYEFDAYLDQMTFDQAHKFIAAAETIRKISPDNTVRNTALHILAAEFKKTLGPAKCGNCKKPVEPINDINSCSC